VEDFLAPRLVGERFDEHTIPLELLKDLGHLEALVVELAKYLYLADHPERQRAPRGFTGTIGLHLRYVDGGSATAGIVLSASGDDLFDAYSRRYLERARPGRRLYRGSGQ